MGARHDPEQFTRASHGPPAAWSAQLLISVLEDARLEFLVRAQPTSIVVPAGTTAGTSRTGPTPRRSRRSIRSIITGLVVAALAVALPTTVQSASASSFTPGDFSAYLVNNPRVTPVADCSTQTGFTVSVVSGVGYRRVGGVRINCNLFHGYLAAHVYIYYRTPDGVWHMYGSGTYGVRYNTYGSGWGISGILRTPEYCVGTLRAYPWAVKAHVWSGNFNTNVWSYYYTNASTGC